MLKPARKPWQVHVKSWEAGISRDSRRESGISRDSRRQRERSIKAADRLASWWLRCSGWYECPANPPSPPPSLSPAPSGPACLALPCGPHLTLPCHGWGQADGVGALPPRRWWAPPPHSPLQETLPPSTAECHRVAVYWRLFAARRFPLRQALYREQCTRSGPWAVWEVGRVQLTPLPPS